MEGYPYRAGSSVVRDAPHRREGISQELRQTTRHAKPRLSRTLLAASIIISLLVTRHAAATDVNVPGGTNLNTLVPANGDTWNLLGTGVYLSNGTNASFAKALPPGTPGLTINGNGNAVVLSDGAAHYANFSGGATTLNLSNVGFSGGKASTGGVINTTGALTLGIAGSVTLANNTATAANFDGGALHSNGSIAIIGNLGSLSLVANSATGTASAGAVSSGTGGTTGDTTITGTFTTISIASNTAGSGAGAIHAFGNIGMSAAVYGPLSITSNTASGGAGGAFQAYGSTGITMDGGYGGIIISGNTAATVGGAFYAQNGAISLNNTNPYGNLSISSNRAGTYGGALETAAAGQSISIKGSYSAIGITDNHANVGTGGGGALAAAQDVVIDTTTSGSMDISRNTTGGDGGALLARLGSITIGGTYAGVTVDSNQAARNGGAFDANQNITLGAGIVGSLDITNNQAKAAGGALYARGNVAVTPLGGVINILGNAAATNGGAIDGGAGVTLNSSGMSAISGNTAGGQGGAIWSGGSVAVTSTSSELAFTGNTAGGLGGAIYVDPTALTLSATGGDISFSGNTQNSSGTPRANAIYIANVNSDTAFTLNAAEGQSITFYDPIQNDGTKGLVTVTKTGSGTVSFDGSNFPTVSDVTDRWSKVYANTEVQGGTFEVANGAAYGDRAADVGGNANSTFTVDAGAALQGGVFGAVVADQVNFQDGATLNLAGRQPDTRSVFGIDAANVNFTPGSVILFNTYLNDASEQNSDRLVLSRTTTSGTAAILVNNVGGPGGLTVGDGIQLVATINGALTNPDSFVLGGRVAAGAYEYNLERGGSVNGDDWFLRNTLPPSPPAPPVPPSPPAPPAPPSPPAPPGPPDPPVPPAPPYPPAPSPPSPPSPQLPDYRIEVPVDSAVPALVNQMGLAMLSNYHDRVGEDYAQLGEAGNEPADNNGLTPNSGWGRVFGTSGSAGYGGGDATDHFNHFMSNGPSYDFNLYGFQTGLDLYRTDDDGDRDIAGVSFGADRVNSDIRSIYDGTKAGDVSMDGYTLGGYWTRTGPTGWYVDSVLQLSRYDSIHASSVEGQQLGTAGWGFDASVEGGYPFTLNDQWKLEPQGQVIYQRISLNDGHDDYGQISYNGSNALYGRLGLRLLDGWKLDNGYPITAWARVNVWGVMGPTPQTTFAGLDGLDAIAFKTTLGSAWWQAQLGVSGRVSTRVSLFGSLDYDRPLTSANGHTIGGRIGVRFVW